jgi:hypothetical protein
MFVASIAVIGDNIVNDNSLDLDRRDVQTSIVDNNDLEYIVRRPNTDRWN